MEHSVERSRPDSPELSRQSEVVVVDPLQVAGWDAMVQKHPEANVFHSSGWCRVLVQTYGHRPLYLRFGSEDAPAALVPLMEVRSLITGRRGVSLPFSDFCDALHFCRGTEPQIFSTIEALAQEHRWRHFELRGGGFVPPSAQPALSFYAHKLDLRGGSEETYRRLRSSVHRALRKPRPAALAISISSSEAAMRTFFHLHAITRGRHGLPPQSLSFFLHIHREIIARGMGSIVLVELDKRPIAAMVFFHWGRQGIYKFGASDKNFQALRPNNIAMWEGIRLLCNKGAHTLHFGRSSMGNEGLRRFKLSWGATEELLHYYRYNAATHTWGTTQDRTEGVHTRFFKMLPPTLNRVAGKILYAHLD
jgi:lipid II:glycine glycyltransferase (peptidoglycan interpeptide bridge formation enzyme)